MLQMQEGRGEPYCFSQCSLEDSLVQNLSSHWTKFQVRNERWKSGWLTRLKVEQFSENHSSRGVFLWCQNGHMLMMSSLLRASWGTEGSIFRVLVFPNVYTEFPYFPNSTCQRHELNSDRIALQLLFQAVTDSLPQSDPSKWQSCRLRFPLELGQE